MGTPKTLKDQLANLPRPSQPGADPCCRIVADKVGRKGRASQLMAGEGLTKAEDYTVVVCDVVMQLFGSGSGAGNYRRVARHLNESATAAQRNHVWNLVRSNQANVKR